MRVRISTTVDGARLAAARDKLQASDSEIVDRALAALLDQIDAAQERAVLEAMPYDEDPELAWEAPTGPSLPYDGEVPAAVLRLAASRRRRR
jgi:hypothetical protein